MMMMPSWLLLRPPVCPFSNKLATAPLLLNAMMNALQTHVDALNSNALPHHLIVRYTIPPSPKPVQAPVLMTSSTS